MSIFTATLSIWMAYRFWRAPSLWRAVALAAAIGLGAMARAELFVLVPFVLIPMVLARRQVPWKRRLRWLGASALVLVVITGTWDLLHNFQQVDLDHFPEGREYWIAWGGLVMFYAFALLSIVGVVVLRRRRIPVYPCVALFLMVFIVITIMFGQNRYRASAETALCLLAAVGVDAILE